MRKSVPKCGDAWGCNFSVWRLEFVGMIVKIRVTVSPWVSNCSNLHAVGPGSAVLVLCRNLRSCKYFRANGCTFQHFSKVFSIEFKLNFGVRETYILSYIFRVFSIKCTLDSGTLVSVECSDLLCSSFHFNFIVFTRACVPLHPMDILFFLFFSAPSSSRVRTFWLSSVLIFFCFSSLSLLLFLFFANFDISARDTGRIGRTFARVSAGTNVVFSGANKSPTSYRGLRFIERRLFDHAGHANFRVETPSDRGSPTAATSTRWDLGRKYLRFVKILWCASIAEQMAAFCKTPPKYLLCNSKLYIDGSTSYVLSYTFRIFVSKFTVILLFELVSSMIIDINIRD
ncbi:hypothetical protein V1477_001655 [Vespula maculifrons]|uniref:Uncharacterized protein n=1 Tax=Vespula maculifrons TaxID=7453 RepID=A0ABD2CYD9_VESMC